MWVDLTVCLKVEMTVVKTVAMRVVKKEFDLVELKVAL